VRPGNGVTSMFYKWDEAEGGWFWTPDQDKAFWMPASTTVVSQGKWEGKSPAFFNVEIINWLAANPMAPPDGVEAKSLDIISREFRVNPGQRTATDQAKLQSTLGTNKMQSTALYDGKTDEEVVLDEVALSPDDTVVIRNSNGSHFTLNGYCTKVMVANCNNCTFTFNGKILTATAEFFMCQALTIEQNTAIKTLQIDGCTGVTIAVDAEDNFQSIVWAGTRDMSVSFADTGLTGTTGFEQMSSRVLGGDEPLREDISQFKTFLEDGEVVTEKVIRLKNGFPSTEREKREFDERQAQNMAAFIKNSGLKIKRTGQRTATERPGRNDPCHCGSTKKYKKCCLLADEEADAAERLVFQGN